MSVPHSTPNPMPGTNAFNSKRNQSHLTHLLSHLLLCSDIAAYNIATHSNRLSHKLNNLINNRTWNNLDQQDKVLNLSNKPLTINQHLVLNLGLSFGLMPERKNNLNFIVAFDKFISDKNYSREEICLKDNLLNAIADLNKKFPVPRRFMKTISSLQKLDDVMSTDPTKTAKS